MAVLEVESDRGSPLHLDSNVRREARPDKIKETNMTTTKLNTQLRIIAQQGARPETSMGVLAEAIRRRKNVDDLLPSVRIPLLRLWVAGHLHILRDVFFAPLPPVFRL